MGELIVMRRALRETTNKGAQSRPPAKEDRKRPLLIQFGKRLRARRIDAGFETARELAESIGVEENTLTKWERGRAQPKFELLILLCHALDTDPNSLLLGRARQERTKIARAQ